MPNLGERIEALEARLKELKVRQQRNDARSRALASRRERRQDLRRKFLVGTIVLARVEDGGFDEKVLRAWLDAALSRADDRALFELCEK